MALSTYTIFHKAIQTCPNCWKRNRCKLPLLTFHERLRDLLFDIIAVHKMDYIFTRQVSSLGAYEVIVRLGS